MKRVLLTGMSGTGKSSLIRELAALGHTAVDVDDAGWTMRAPDGGWIWREDPVERFLTQEREGLVFLSGCAESQVRFYPLFDHVVLLSAPPAVLMERLLERSDNPYGKRAEERAEVLRHVRTVEPLLRRSADHEIDTTAPLADVLAEVLRIAGEPGGDARG